MAPSRFLNPTEIAYILMVIGLFFWLIVLLVVGIISSVAAFCRFLRRIGRR